MAERLEEIKSYLTKQGYDCNPAERENTTGYFTFKAKTGNYTFGIGYVGGRLAIIRFSPIDGQSGMITFPSSTSSASSIASSIELLARCAMIA